MELEALSQRSREMILSRIRKTRPVRLPDAVAELPAPVTPVPAWSYGDEPLSRLRIAMMRMKAELTELKGLEDIPGHVAKVLKAEGAPLDVVIGMDPVLRPLLWDDAGLRVHEPSFIQSDWAGVSRALCAVLETGSVVLVSGPENPTNINFMVRYHFAVMRADMILPTLDDLWRTLLPFFEKEKRLRAVNIISGPSATADVEATLTVGAHGPCRFELLVTKGLP